MPYISHEAEYVARKAKEARETCKRIFIDKKPLAIILEAQSILKEQGITDVSILPSGIAGGGKYLVLKRKGECR